MAGGLEVGTAATQVALSGVEAYASVPPAALAGVALRQGTKTLSSAPKAGGQVTGLVWRWCWWDGGRMALGGGLELPGVPAGPHACVDFPSCGHMSWVVSGMWLLQLCLLCPCTATPVDRRAFGAMAGSCGKCMCNFLGTSQTVCHSHCPDWQ